MFKAEDLWKISAVVLGAILVILALLIGDSWSERYGNLAVLVFGTCSGWLIGTLISPYGKKEKEEFSEYTKAVTVFASGYAVAKIDKAIEKIFDPTLLFDSVSGFRLLGFLSSFIIAMLVTFISRRYVTS